MPPTHRQLLEHLHYDPDTGVFKQHTCSHCGGPGPEVGWIEDGYRYVQIAKKKYRAHRLAWFYAHGSWPTKMIDHIDGNPLNNQLSNLRDVTASVNQQNRIARGYSIIGGRYQARIKTGGKITYLGIYDTPEEAHEAYMTAKREHHAGWAR